MSDLPRIGFIGLGVMGRSMGRHIRAAGYPLNVFNRTKERAEEIIALGASWKSSPRDVAEVSDIVITMVRYPHDVERVYFGDDGLLAGIAAGGLLIDMTTSTPSLAQRIHAAAAEKGVGALDAPVSGGDVGAREARLTIMVGGEEADFDRARLR